MKAYLYIIISFYSVFLGSAHAQTTPPHIDTAKISKRCIVSGTYTANTELSCTYTAEYFLGYSSSSYPKFIQLKSASIGAGTFTTSKFTCRNCKPQKGTKGVIMQLSITRTCADGDPPTNQAETVVLTVPKACIVTTKH